MPQCRLKIIDRFDFEIVAFLSQNRVITIKLDENFDMKNYLSTSTFTAILLQYEAITRKVTK